MSLYWPRRKSGRSREEKNLLPSPGIERFSQPIAQSLNQLSYTGSQHFMMQKFLQQAAVIRPVKEISAFGKPQIHCILYQRHALDPACYEPAASSPQLYSCITSASLLQQNVTAAVQLLLCACSPWWGPNKYLHTQAGCTTLFHFSVDYLSVKSRTGVLKAATAAVPQGRFDCQQWPSCS